MKLHKFSFMRILKGIVIALLIAGVLVFFGYPLLVMFGVVNYALPISQPVDNLACIQLLNTEGNTPVLIDELPDEQIDDFYNELIAIRARAYSNDPQFEPGKRSVKLCYKDGSYDLYSFGYLALYDSNGEKKPLNRWYYMSTKDLNRLLEQFFGNY